MRHFVLSLAAIITLAACAKENPDPNDAASAVKAGSASPDDGALPDRDPALAKKLVAEGAVLLDVRTQEEWDERHLDGAQHVPVDKVAGRLDDIEKMTGGDKNKAIVVYCRSGGRAARAKKTLLDAGYKRVTNMGGITDWPAD